jgi:hypothetical protein
MENLKKVDYKQSFTSIKWMPRKPPSMGTVILVDIQNLFFMKTLEYMNKTMDKITYVHDYITDIYIDTITQSVSNVIKELSKKYFVNVIGINKNHGHHKLSLKSLNPLDINSYTYFLKEINKVILHTTFDVEKLTDIIPDESVLNDPDLKIASMKGLALTTDLNILLYGKEEIVKYENGKWYCKYRENMKSILQKPNDSLLYTCILLGCSYAHAKKIDKKKDILNNPHKFDSVCKMLESQSQIQFLEYIKKLPKDL